MSIRKELNDLIDYIIVNFDLYTYNDSRYLEYASQYFFIPKIPVISNVVAHVNTVYTRILQVFT